MSAQELITEHLDLWTGAVRKKSSSGRGSNGKVELTGVRKLRELILELAVRGKLVEQNPADEPASKLLERLRAEKLNLMKQGEIKKRRKLPELSEMTIPFHVPSSWEWAQLEDVGRDWGQKAPSNEFSYIDVASVDNLRGATSQPSILSADEAPSRARKIVREGTLIYSTIRPYLQNIAVVESEIEPEPIASTAFAVLHPLDGMPPRFFLHYLRSPAFVRYVESVQTGIAYPAINDKQFFSGLVPVPPLEEQHRIAQKVDELMALCDRLEQQTSDQLEVHEALVDTLLGTLTQSENATELADNWARLTAHFDTLFTTEQSIDKLKQTILQLAVVGRLVEQDKGAAESQSNQPLQASKTDELPQLPRNWQWLKIRDIADVVRGGSPRPAGDPRFYGGPIPFLKVGDITRLKGKFVTHHTYSIKEAGLRKTRYIEERTVLLSNSGATLGIPAICEFPTAFNDGIAAFINLSNNVFDEFLYLFLKTKSHWFLEYASRGQGQPNLNTDIIKSTAIPLPPKPEQRRIVQKVDELMALCDQLKERLNQASETRCQLAEAVVEGALN